MPPRDFDYPIQIDAPHWFQNENATIAYDNITINANDIYTTTNEGITNEITNFNFADISFVTKKDLDLFAKRIYRIISDHTKIDISEDEFMDILKGANNE